MRVISLSIIFFVQLGVIQLPSCWVGHSDDKAIRTADGNCDRGWKSVEDEHFRFCVPDSFEQLRSQSADTALLKFGNEELSVKVEYGSHVTLIKRRSGGYNADEIGEKRVVDGRHGTIRNYVIHDDEIEWDPDLKARHFVAELYIDSVHSSLSKFQMTVFSKSELERDLAIPIFKSIRFKTVD